MDGGRLVAGTWSVVLWSRNFLLTTMSDLDKELDQLQTGGCGVGKARELKEGFLKIHNFKNHSSWGPAGWGWRMACSG